MKFGITRYELFALTSHLVALPSSTPEHGRRRLRAWDELGVPDLADTLATMVARMGGSITIAEWNDKKTPHLIDLSADVLVFALAGLGTEISGVWADTLIRLRERLEALRDKTYELPAELRELKAVP